MYSIHLALALGLNNLGNRSRSDATAHVDDVIIPLGLTFIVDQKVLTHVSHWPQIGPMEVRL